MEEAQVGHGAAGTNFWAVAAWTAAGVAASATIAPMETNIFNYEEALAAVTSSLLPIYVNNSAMFKCPCGDMNFYTSNELASILSDCASERTFE